MSAYPRISAFQFATILTFSYSVFPPLWTANDMLYEHLGHRAWMVLPAACLFTLFQSCISLDLAKSNPSGGLPDWSRQWLGKWLGSIYIFAVLIVVFLWGVLNYKMFWYMIDFTQLRETPSYLPNLYMIGAVVYLLMNGLETWARVSQLLWAGVLLFVIVLQASELSNCNFSRLLPLTPVPLAEFRNWDIVSMILMIPGSFLIFFIYPNLKERKHLLRWMIGALIITGVILLMIIVIPIAIFGEAPVNVMAFPTQESVATVSIEFLPIKKLVFLTPIVWQLVIVFTLGASLYCAAQCLQSLLPSRPKRWPLLILGAVTYALSIITVDYPTLVRYFKNWTLANLVLFVAIPFLIWAVVKTGIGGSRRDAR